MLPLRDTVPSVRRPVVTWALIAVNVAVFVYQLTLGHQEVRQLFLLYGVVPARFTDPGWAAQVGYPPARVVPFVTSMFLHGGFFHLLTNLWTLWIFGDNVEDRMGRGRYLAFYLTCGLGAGLVHLLTNLGSTVPTIGASGAIAGILGAYLALFPAARVVTLVPLLFWPLFFELPAVVFLGIWFVTQLASGASALAAGAAGAGGVAWWAHVGGFLVGFGLYRLFLGPPPPAPPGPRVVVVERPRPTLWE